jgi:hypothetical protein
MITRRDFTKALSLLPLAGVVPVFPILEYEQDSRENCESKLCPDQNDRVINCFNKTNENRNS